MLITQQEYDELKAKIAELETEVARMNKTQCPYCGSVGTCHDSCVGVDIEPLKKRIAELEAERDEARRVAVVLMTYGQQN